MNDRSIAIIGMACVFPGARTLDEFWSNIVNGVDAVTEIPSGRLNFADRFPHPPEHEAYVPCRRGGFLPSQLEFEPRRYGIMPNIVTNGDPDQFLMLDVVASALADGGISDDARIREATDVIIGRGGYMTNKYGEFYLRSEACDRLVRYLGDHWSGKNGEEAADLARRLWSTFPALEPDSISTCIPNLVASRVANRLNLRGAAYTIDAACASSLLAIEHAISRLRSGQCELAVAGGIHLFQTPGFWFVFSKLGALSPTSTIRPFDRRADGLVPAEGAGAIVLKRLADACRDGDHIYAIIRGSGSSSDGHDTAILAPSSSGQVMALRRAYRDAQVDPESISYLEAHGTGTQLGDETEIKTINSFFGSRGSYPSSRGMGSVKSMIGHAMPAAGIASVIKTALAISRKVLPPSLHCDEPHPLLEESPFYIVSQTRPWIHETGSPRRAGVNALGFGGTNSHVVLEEVIETCDVGPTVPLPRSFVDRRRCETELVVFSGNSKQEVLDTLDHLAQRLAGGLECSLAELAQSFIKEYDSCSAVKLATVCRDIPHLIESIPQGRTSLEAGAECFDEKGWYFTSSGQTPKGKIACIFPGIGFPGLIGNYPDHLMELCLHLPEVRSEFDLIERRDRHPDDPIPTSIIFAPPANLSDEQRMLLRERIAAMKVIENAAEIPEIHPADRNIAASGVTVTNWVSWKVLEKLGVPTDMVCGQSQGEMAALCAAGALSIREIIPRFWDALAIAPTYAGKGRLAFVQISEEQLRPYLGAYPSIQIAIHVAPHAQVIGGVEDEINVLMEDLRKARILATALPYPPIHTPQLGYLRDELLRVLDTRVTFSKPTMPIYSAVLEDIFPEDFEDVRNTALANLDRPVRFWQTIHKMYDAGARIFIQVGGGSLAANIASVLPKEDIIGTAVDLDHRDPITQLNHLCATLITAGVSIQPERLFEHRNVPAVDWRNGATSDRPKLNTVPLRLDWTPFDVRRNGSATPGTNGHATNGKFVATDEPAAAVAKPDSHREEPISEDTSIPPALADERRMPFVGTILEYVPGERICVEHELDINGDLYLRDHLFIHAPGIKPAEKCLPVMPLTMILEAMAEVAACLAPGCGVVGFENVRAQRWVALEDRPTMPIQIQAERMVDGETGVVRIQVTLTAESMVRTVAVVLLADHYQQKVELSFTPITGSKPWPFHVDEIYRDGHLFHGPEFQIITQLLEFGDNGCTAELTIRPKDRLFSYTNAPELMIDPAILDATGQVVGLWAVAFGVTILPSGLERIEFYQPTSPPGTRLMIRCDVTEVNAEKRIMRSNIEVLDERGKVWFRIIGWKDWLYRYPDKTRHFRRRPCEYCVSDEQQLERLPQGDVCRSVMRTDVQDVTLAWLERLFLHEQEVDEFRRLKLPKRQWEWILGRIAAKDAVRIWHARKTGCPEMLHPAAFAIVKDDRGKPYIRASAAIPDPPEVSIAHSRERAVAVAARMPIGIDIESATVSSSEVMPLVLSDFEVELLQTLSQRQPNGAWPARFWAAKEAASKAIGTGLDGRPADFEAIDCEDDGQILVHHHPTSERMCVFTQLDQGSVIAVTTHEEQAEVSLATYEC